MRQVTAGIVCVFLMAGMLCAAEIKADETVEDVFARESRRQIVLDIEAALARAQAAYGVIPQAAADDISAKADLSYVPDEQVRAEYQMVRHRMVALLNVWRRALSETGGNYVHYGATTVDIYDTALVLQLRRSVDLFIDDLTAINALLIALAETHRDTPMIGRTLGQHALPITFGKKVSTWIGETSRHIERLREIKAQLDRSAILKGAVGSYAGLGAKALDIEKRFAQELGLSTPYADDWHGARDVFADYALTLALIAKSYGRLGQEIFLLQSTDVGEVVERRPKTAVGSSTMPHKINPSRSEALIQASREIPHLAESVLDDVMNFYERDNTSRPNRLLGTLSVRTEAMLIDTKTLLRRLEVRPDAMRANLNRTGGLIMAQRVVFALSASMDRSRAEEAVRTAALRSLETKISFQDALLAISEINDHLDAESLSDLLDPEGYLGEAGALVDATIQAARRVMAEDMVP